MVANKVLITLVEFKQLEKPTNPLERESFDLVGDQLDESQG